MTWWLLSAAVWPGHALQAQSGPADSLLTIAQSKQPDSVRVRAMVDFAKSEALKRPNELIRELPPIIDLGRKLRDTLQTAELLRNLGIAYNMTGNRDTGLYYYFEVIKLLEPSRYRRELAYAYNDVARHNRRFEPARAVEFYKKALDIFEELGDREGQATILNESGVAYENMGNDAEAEKRYRASLAIQQERNDSLGISYSLSFLSGILLKQGKTADAEQLALQAFDIRRQLRDSFALAIAATNLGELYRQTGRHQQAIPYFEQSNAIAERISYLDIQSHNWGEIASAYEALGRYREALDAKGKHVAIKDSIYQIAKAKQIEELNTKYETAVKERTIQEQAFELSRKNYLLAAGALLLLLGSTVAYSLHRRNQYRHQQQLQAERLRQQEEATRAVMEAEENERKRIATELHDGVGQLMSAARMNLAALSGDLKGLQPEERSRLEQIEGLVDEGCREVRQVSHQMMPNTLLKKGLASAVRDFLEKIDRRVLNVNLHTEGLQERLDSQTETMLYRIIQECVNNVIKHSGASSLDMSLIRENSHISVTIEDNGKGFTYRDDAEGIGLRNMKSRVQYLKGTLDIDSAPGSGTLIAIHVPLNDANANGKP